MGIKPRTLLLHEKPLRHHADDICSILDNRHVARLFPLIIVLLRMQKLSVQSDGFM